MITLFFGEDQFSIQQEISKKIKAVSRDTETIFYQKETLETLPNELMTNSFFTQKRLFVIKNKLENLSPILEKNVIDSLNKISGDTSIIFVELKSPKGKIAKFFKDNGEIIKFENPKGADLITFIKKRVTEEGADISPLAAERLLSYVGADFWQLEEEIKKLTLYKKGDREEEAIQIVDVDELVKASFESNIFDLMDAISAKNTKRAQSLMNSFLESGENAIYILTMIARQFRNIAMAKMEPNVNQNILAKKAGIHPFVAKKSIEQARNFEKYEILNIYEKIGEADLKLKSGFEPSHVLEEFVLN